LWDDDEGGNSYVGDPMAELRKENPDLLINIAASPFSYTHFDERIKVLSQQVTKSGRPLIYVNQIGAHMDIIFDGRSIALNNEGTKIGELKSFEEDLQFVTYYQQNITSTTASSKESIAEMALIHDALILGLRDYFQ
jgi:NAD+ synthase (glutamine-hydrolysing)